MAHDVNDRKLMILGWFFHFGGLFTLVLGTCVYQFVVTGLITHQHSPNTEEIARIEGLLHADRNVGREFSKLQEDLANLEARAEAGRQRIPETPEEAEFLAQVSAAATEKGLVIDNFTRGEISVSDTHSEMQIRLTGEGDYTSICGFFDKMSSFSRVATVSNMTISIPSNTEIYPLDMTLTLYFGARAPQGGGNG